MKTSLDKFKEAVKKFELPDLSRHGNLKTSRNALHELTRAFENRIRHVRNCCSNPRAHTLPEVHHRFLNSSDINAVAFKYRGKFFVGIFEGVLSRLFRVYMAMLAEPEILSDFDKGTEEIKGRSRKLSGSLPFVLPRSDIREQISTFLFNQSVNMITFHELHHVLGGHLDFLEENHYVAFLCERNTQGETFEYAEVTRALEMDADARAIQETSLYLKSHSQFSPEETMELFFFSICVFTRLLGSKYNENWKHQPHPPFFLRRYSMCLLAADYLKPDNHDSNSWLRITERLVDKADKNARFALEYVIKEAPRIPGLEYTLDLDEGPEFPLSTECFNETQTVFPDIQKRLKQLTYLPVT